MADSRYYVRECTAIASYLSVACTDPLDKLGFVKLEEATLNAAAAAVCGAVLQTTGRGI
jgi:hypothetical protein